MFPNVAVERTRDGVVGTSLTPVSNHASMDCFRNLSCRICGINHSGSNYQNSSAPLRLNLLERSLFDR
jgi:hypothetical protein